MKQHLNEIRKMQHIAGLINQSQSNEAFEPDYDRGGYFMDMLEEAIGPWIDSKIKDGEEIEQIKAELHYDVDKIVDSRSKTYY